MAVSIPARIMIRIFIPNKLYANVAPITVKTPRPIASNFKKRFQCLLSLECRRNMITPVITVITGIIIFLLHSRLSKHWNLFLKFDAIGLGVFTVIGATFAYNLFGMNLLIIVLAGMLTAIGGGILRDIFVNQTPIVFVKEFYASASFIGVIVFYFVLMFSDQLYVATISGIVITTGLRLIAMKYNWNLPKVRGNI